MEVWPWSQDVWWPQETSNIVVFLNKHRGLEVCFLSSLVDYLSAIDLQEEQNQVDFYFVSYFLLFLVFTRFQVHGFASFFKHQHEEDFWVIDLFILGSFPTVIISHYFCSHFYWQKLLCSVACCQKIFCFARTWFLVTFQDLLRPWEGSIVVRLFFLHIFFDYILPRAATTPYLSFFFYYPPSSFFFYLKRSLIV